jgi:hypothetical protein
MAQAGRLESSFIVLYIVPLKLVVRNDGFEEGTRTPDQPKKRRNETGFVSPGKFHPASQRTSRPVRKTRQAAAINHGEHRTE